MSFIDEIKNLDFKNLDPENPGLWPLPVQLALSAVVAIAILIGGYYFLIKGQRGALAKIERKEVELKGAFEKKQKKAANLEALEEQMQEMEQSFGDMIRQLPNKTEIAGLIVDISQTGLAAGLEFDLFQPQTERPTEYYAELPINLKVKGSYHQLGEFVSGTAALPRIVTTHDITIEKESDNVLRMDATAKTYRAVEGEEEE